MGRRRVHRNRGALWLPTSRRRRRLPLFQRVSRGHCPSTQFGGRIARCGTGGGCREAAGFPVESSQIGVISADMPKKSDRWAFRFSRRLRAGFCLRVRRRGGTVSYLPLPGPVARQSRVRAFEDGRSSCAGRIRPDSSGTSTTAYPKAMHDPEKACPGVNLITRIGAS